MRRLLPIICLLLPFVTAAQVITPRDTTKPKVRIDTAEFWNDSLFNLPRQKILRDGAVFKAPKAKKNVSKFKRRKAYRNTCMSRCISY
jgi:hypothetical protein